MTGKKRITVIKSYKIDELKSATPKNGDFGCFRLEDFLKDIEQLKAPHRHDHFAVFFINAGKGEHAIDFKKYTLRKNRVFLLTPGQIHAWKFERKSAGYVLLFSKEFFSVANQNRDLRNFLFYRVQKAKPYFDMVPQTGNDVMQLFKQIEKECSNGEVFAYQFIRSYLNILLLKLTRLHNQSAGIEVSVSAAFRKVREYERIINKNYKSMRAVTDYARLLRVTPNYLNAVCKKVVGKPAGAMLRERILLEAKRLLANTDSTASEIAYQLNFEDNSYFGRFFKKNTKTTPAKFRERTRRKIN